MSRPTYRDYRRFGHGRMTAFVLSCPAVLWYGTAMIVGLLLSSL